MDYATPHKDGIDLLIRLTPAARSNGFAGLDTIQDRHGNTVTALKARVTAAPENNKANKALIALLAAALRIAKSDISIVRGDTDRTKTIRISRTIDAALLEALQALPQTPTARAP